jgi:hypothetical protein
MADPQVLLVDSFDTSDLNLLVDSRIDNWRSGHKQTRKSVQVPGELYATYVTNKKTGGARKILCRSAVLAPDRPTLEANLDELEAKLYVTQQITFVDRLWGHYDAELDGELKVRGNHPAMTGRAVFVDIPFKAVDPRYHKTSGESVPFTGATVMPLGNAPSHAVITVSVGSFTLTYSGGGTLTVTGATNPPITVDMFNKTIINASSNSMIAKLTAGNFFAFDEGVGTATGAGPDPTGTFGTLATSAGSGTAVYNKEFRG